MHDCEVSVQASIGEDFQGVLAALFALGGAVLRKGGALVTWLPFTQDWLGSAAKGEPTNNFFKMPYSLVCRCMQLFKPHRRIGNGRMFRLFQTDIVGACMCYQHQLIAP